jgi:hypothetical protein
MADSETDYNALVDEALKAPKPSGTVVPFPGAAPQQPQPDYGGLVDDVLQMKRQAATQNLMSAQGSDPEKAAQAAAISRQTGVPQPAVERDLPTAQENAQLGANVKTLADSPRLAGFVADNPLAARIARDDFDKLGTLEKAWTALKSGAVGAVESDVVGRLGAQEQQQALLGQDQSGTDQAVREVQSRLATQPKLAGGWGLAQNLSGFVTGLIDNFVQGGTKAAVYGAGIGAAMGAPFAGVGAGPGAAMGFAAGAVRGWAVDMAQVAAGNAYLKLKTMRSTEGLPMSETGAQVGAAFTGLATYALGTYTGALERKFAGETADSLAQKALDQAVTRPTFQRALTDFTVQTGKAAVRGGLTMTAMEGASLVGEEISKSLSEGNFPTDSAEVVSRLSDAFVNGAVLLGTLHATQSGMRLYGSFRAAARAGDNAQMFQNILDGAKDSKLRSRDLQAFQDLMQRQTDGSPVEDLFIPAEVIRKVYAQSGVVEPVELRNEDALQVRNATPAGTAELPGVSRAVDEAQTRAGSDPLFGFVRDMPRQLAEAHQTGGDVVIPAADFVAHLAGTPLAERLLPDIRVGANAMSVNEAKAYAEAYKARVGEAVDTAAKESASTEPSSEQRIQQDVYRQARAAGVPEAQAAASSQVLAARYATRGERLGVDPWETYQQAGGAGALKIQAGEQAPEGALAQAQRGSIQFGGGQTLVTLLAKKDPSTLIHESGHAWLEELMQDAARPDAPEGIKADLKTVLDYLGVKDQSEVGVEQHERFARTAEAYLMEGKAPSFSLAAVFSRFKTWLTRLYQSVSTLDVPISDEIRGVFDRLLATDGQIEAAQHSSGLMPQFATREEAGMTAAEWGAYLRTIERAKTQAETTLLERTMAPIRRERTAEYKADFAAAQDAAAKEVDARRDIQALTLLRDGRMPDGTEQPMKIDRAEFERIYGPDSAKSLPRGTTAKTGFHPDAIAEVLGYGSGDEMVQDLRSLQAKQAEVQAEGAKGGIRSYLIDQLATEKTAATAPDEASVREEAIAAVHSDKQAELLAMELRYLRRTAARHLVNAGEARLERQEEAAGRDKMREAVAVTRPMLDDLRSRADAILANQAVEQVEGFSRYLRDERSAARLVQEAVRKGDWEAAAMAKQRQLMSNILYGRAREAAQEVLRGKNLFERLAAKPTFPGMDQAYTDQIHSLLERFQIGTGRDPGELARGLSGVSLGQFVQRDYDNGAHEIPLSPFAASGSGDLATARYADFRDVAATVRALQAAGRDERTVTVGDQRVEKTWAVAELRTKMGDLTQRAPSPYLSPQDRPAFVAMREKTLSFLRSANSSLLKMETVFDWLDGGDSNGPFNRMIFRPLKAAQLKLNIMREGFVNDIRALRESLPGGWEKALGDVVVEHGLADPRTMAPFIMTRKSLLGIALNWGTEDNATKLAGGYGWTHEAVQSVLDRSMAPADWKFVRGMWEAIGKYGPELDDLQRRVTGTGIEFVKGRAVQTAEGEIEGKYWPIFLDSSRSIVAERNLERSAGALLEPNQYQRATTRNGSAYARVEHALPIDLNLDNIQRKVGETLHDLAFREALTNADKLLSDADVIGSIDSTLGPEYRQQMRPWLQAIANSANANDRAMGWLNGFINKARTNATMVGIGFRISTLEKHTLSALAGSVAEIGPKWLAVGTKELFSSPENMERGWNWAMENSQELRFRRSQYDRDLNQSMTELVGEGGLQKANRKAQEFGHYGIATLDLTSAVPTWIGAVRKAESEGMDPGDAYYAADKAVRRAHGAQYSLDLAPVQQWNNPLARMFTMFYGFMNSRYNRLADITRQASGIPGKVGEGEWGAAGQDFAMVLGRSFGYIAVPGLVAALVSKGQPDEYKDEGWWGWAAKAVGGELAGTIPVVRDIATAALEGREYEPTPLARVVTTLIKTGKDIGQITGATDPERPREPSGIGRDFAETFGYLTGAPTGQAAASAKFLWDVNQGEQNPEGLGDWIRGLMSGKVKH